MKKNAMLKIAAILMVAVLLTTCAISSTFAKYVTTGDPSDTETARVAKWGVTIESSASGIFAKAFENGSADEDGNDVASTAATDNLLAPGTSKTGAIAATLEGTPEVAFKFETAANVTFTGWTVDGNFYCPLVVKVDNVAYKSGDKYNDANNIEKTIDSAANFAECIELAIEAAGTQEFPAATAIDSVETAINIPIEWSWAFSTDADGDDKDTALAALDATNTISIAVTQSATQIQNYS